MKLNLSARFLMLALLCGSCVLNTPKEELEYNGMNTLQISNVDDLISFYQYADDRIPLISGHRGGRGKGYPENSMETFENTLSYTPATFEIDPRLTKDSVIVLFHDDTLERTIHDVHPPVGRLSRGHVVCDSGDERHRAPYQSICQTQAFRRQKVGGRR